MLSCALGLLGLSGCRSWQDFRERAIQFRHTVFDSNYQDPKAQEKMAEADRLFAEGRFAQARKIYKQLADNQGNPADLAERARFLQAECRFYEGHYPEAVDTYHRLLLDYPTGAHRREACNRMYQIADYWLNDFRDELVRRKNETGILYWRPSWPNPFDRTRPMIDQEGRLLETLNNIWVQDITGPYSDKALFWCGYINFVRGNFQEADHFFSQLVELHKESPLLPQALLYAVISKNAATGGPDHDIRRAAEALQLVHMAETSMPEITQDPQLAERLQRAKYAIRQQQAEHDLRTAEYYERTGHPGSAVFYYELVRRRYAGTRYADLATQRKEHLLALARAGRPAPGNDPFARLQAKWKEWFGGTMDSAGLPGNEQFSADPKSSPAANAVRHADTPAGHVTPAGPETSSPPAAAQQDGSSTPTMGK
ncbi:MAG: tetratricopeptide repeat protein [Thermogemmata sp.]|nr:tetratricopeptide repeat protein [Thermogemmata sp.]